MKRVRHWPTYSLLLLLTLLLGVGSRVFAAWLPGWVAAYAGDVLWALLIFWLLGLLRPAWSSARVGAVGLAFAFGIEISQLYHAPWLDVLRATVLGGLVLGHGFLWSDLVCYAVGVGMGYVLEQGWRKAGAAEKNSIAS